MHYSLEGNVFNSKKNRLDYFNVLLYSAMDSSFVKGGAFDSGYFKISLDNSKSLILKILCMGQTYSSIIDFRKNNNIKLDSIIINENIALAEVTVMSRRPIYKYSKGKMLINVQSTSISDAGSAIDVLKRTPGVIVDNLNTVSIFGKGSPIIFIDGKEIRSNDELENLQSGCIKKIEIDKNPSSIYSASAASVINITTTSSSKDFLSVEVYDRSGFARKLSNISGIQINDKISKFQNFLNYQFSTNNSRNFLDEYDINQQNNYIIDNITNRVSNRNKNKHLLLLSSAYKIDSTRNICIQYRYSSLHGSQNDNSIQNILNSSSSIKTTRNISDLTDNTANSNNVTAIYNQQFLKKLSFSTIFDFYSLGEEKSENIKELLVKEGQFNTSQINNINNNGIISWKSDVTAKILKTNFTFGIKLTQINSDWDVRSYNLLTDSLFTDETSEIKDNIYASFIEFERSFKKLTFKMGSRVEYSKSIITINKLKATDSSYWKLFPTCMINYKKSENFLVDFNYTKKISRPSFDDLNPTYKYIDAISYKVGNPMLQPKISDSFCVNLSFFKSFNVSGELLINKNEIASAVALNDPINPNIIKYTSINIQKSNHLIFNGAYSYTGKKYTFSTSLGADIPSIKIPYLDKQITIDKPIFFINLNNDYTLNKYFSCYLNFYHQSEGQDQITTYGQVYNLSTGMKAKMFKKRLTLSLDINDVLNRSDMSWEDNYGNLRYGQNPDYDTRYLRFSIKYTFNNFLSSYIDRTSIDNEIKRIGN